MTQSAKRSTKSTQDLMTGDGVSAADTPAVPAFSLKPIIKNATDVARALVWLSWYESRASTVMSRVKQSIALIRDTAAADLQVTLPDGEQVALEDHAKAIDSELTRYCGRVRKSFFKESKTVRFAAGEMQLRKSPARLESEDDKQQVVERLVTALSKEDQQSLTAIRERLAPWVRMKLELDSESIKLAVKEQRLTDKDLQRRGLKIVAGEVVKVKVYAYDQRQVAAAEGHPGGSS